jgi:sarcosine oxidase subunit alpha
VEAAVAALRAMPDVRIVPRATAFGYHDHNLVAVAERVSDHLAPGERPRFAVRERLWKVRAREVVLATGSFERPLVFANNDLPGVMLAGAAAGYAVRHAVRAGRRAVVFTNNDSGHGAAATLQRAGIEVSAIVDTRPASATPPIPELAHLVLPGSAVVAARGSRRVRDVLVAPLSPDGASLAGAARAVACDHVCVSGGWNPVVHLFSQSGGTLAFDAAKQCFVPGASRQAERSAGACRGTFDLAGCLAEGAVAGASAARAAGFPSAAPDPAPDCSPTAWSGVAPIREIPAPSRHGPKTRFVDILNDVTVADLRLAAHEGYGSPELAKRYTTAGMGVDQGKTGNINALAILGAAQGGQSPDALGTTTFRPPYTPVTFGTMAGGETGARFDPLRRTPMTDWHERNGAVFEPVGRWQRPMYYTRTGETMAAAVRRECLATRNAVALCDASTLGKIEIRGPDAVRLLDMLYTNRWGTLAKGRCRYGVMLRDDGMVFDDGTTSRLGDEHFFMTTTSGHADAVAAWIDEWLQCEWPSWQVFSLPVTTQWATVMVTGPRSRELLGRVGTDIDLAREACRFMTVHEGEVAGFACRMLRVSFTGELSYELYVPAGSGLALWERLLAAGQDLGVTPIGTEALHVLRAEKGFFVVGHDTDATVSPLDLGIGQMVDRRKPDFIGRRSLQRAELARPDRQQYVGLLTDDPAVVVQEGSPVVEMADARDLRRTPVRISGRVTSSYASPALDRSICLGLVTRGLSRTGDSVLIIDRGVARPARICSPRFHDPEGRRLDG